MFLARREFGKVLRVYEIRGGVSPLQPREWIFSGGRAIEGVRLAICGPGHCVLRNTRDAARHDLRAHDEAAEGSYIDEMTVVNEVKYGR